MKRKLLRIVGLLLFPLILFMVLPVTAQAESVLDGAISITVKNDNSTLCNAPSLSVNGTTATAKATVGSGVLYKTVSYTITITNNSAGRLSFKWSVANSSSFKDPNGGSTVSGTYSKELTAGSSLTMQVKASSKSTTATLTISELAFEEASGKNTTFNFNSNGTVSVAGTAITSGSTHLLDANGVSLTATPKSGCSFLGWVKADTRAVISRDATFTYGALEETTIEAVFVNSTSDTAWFFVDNTYLVDDLTTAGSKGTKIVLMNDGTLSGSHTIASDDTLLIPCDAAHTVYTTKPGDDGGDTYAKTEVYRKLTMAQGASITVNGAISIGGKIGTNMTGEVVSTAYYYTNGAPSGPLGYIVMNSGSSITVNSGGNLYAWGFVTGSGAVTVKSGGSIYENLQIRDWRGGNCTTSILSDKDTYEVLPFSQYYIQNVECPLTLEAGATQNVCTAVSYSIVINTMVSKESAVFLGSDSGLIRLSSGSLTRTYDGSTDRIIYDLNGDITFANLSIAITISAGTNITINSEDYIMPLNSNMTLNVNSGSNVSMNQDFFLLPGAILEIENGSTVTMDSGKRLIAYDSAQWGSYCSASNYKLNPVYYAPGRTGTRSASSLVDAKIIVDGTLDATSGYLYTTSSGANVTSNGSGVLKTTKGTQTVTYQITQSGTTPSYPEIAITPAQLLNSDGTTYVATGTSTASPNTYTYTNGNWICEKHTDADTNNICDVCGITICEHANTEVQNAKEATCTEDGYSGDTVCTTCKTTVKTGTVITAAGSHSGGTATCTEQAKCNICGQEYGDALGHTYADPVVNFSDDGATYTVTVTCSECAEGTEDRIKTSEEKNSTVQSTTPGDCQTNSTTTYEASGEFEGVAYSDTKLVEGELGTHTPGADATCTTAQTCTVCGAELVPALNHKDDDKDHACDNKCGVYQGTHADSRDDGDHVCDYGCGAVLENCADVTTDDNHSCDVCGKADVTVHVYTEAVTPPTCTEDGFTTYTCNCGHTYTDKLVEAQHSIEQGAAQEKTCTQDGWEAYEYCTKCSYSTKVVIPAGHTLTFVAEKAASCTEAGNLAHWLCDVCGKCFADEQAQGEIADVTVPKAEHAGVNTTYSQIADKAEHNVIVTCKCGEVVSTTVAACADDNLDGKCDQCERMLNAPIVPVNKTGKEDIWTITGNTMNVKHELACVVLVKQNNDTYRRIEATENTAGGYDFDVSGVQNDETVVIAVKGDIDGDGVANAADTSIINRHIVTNDAHRDLLDNEIPFADVDGDGTVDAADASVINRSIVTNSAHKDIEW